MHLKCRKSLNHGVILFSLYLASLALASKPQDRLRLSSPSFHAHFHVLRFGLPNLRLLLANH